MSELFDRQLSKLTIYILPQPEGICKAKESSNAEPKVRNKAKENSERSDSFPLHGVHETQERGCPTEIHAGASDGAEEEEKEEEIAASSK